MSWWVPPRLLHAFCSSRSQLRHTHCLCKICYLLFRARWNRVEKEPQSEWERAAAASCFAPRKENLFGREKFSCVCVCVSWLWEELVLCIILLYVAVVVWESLPSRLLSVRNFVSFWLLHTHYTLCVYVCRLLLSSREENPPSSCVCVYLSLERNTHTHTYT